MPQPPLLSVAFGTAFVYILIPVPVKLNASPHGGDVAAKFLLAPFLFTDATPLALFDDVIAAQRPLVAGLCLVPPGADIQLHRLGVQAIRCSDEAFDVAEPPSQRRAHRAARIPDRRTPSSSANALGLAFR